MGSCKDVCKKCGGSEFVTLSNGLRTRCRACLGGYVDGIKCPKCGNIEEDFDGLGFMCCDKCGHCIHPNSTLEGDKWICGFCGKEIKEDEKSK